MRDCTVDQVPVIVTPNRRCYAIPPVVSSVPAERNHPSKDWNEPWAAVTDGQRWIERSSPLSDRCNSPRGGRYRQQRQPAFRCRAGIGPNYAYWSRDTTAWIGLAATARYPGGERQSAWKGSQRLLTQRRLSNPMLRNTAAVRTARRFVKNPAVANPIIRKSSPRTVPIKSACPIAIHSRDLL